jgi:PHD/YefM family antitoxin component YafN of YafNO toxin-antitoxin module
LTHLAQPPLCRAASGYNAAVPVTSGHIEKTGKWWAAEVPILGVCTQGRSKQDAYAGELLRLPVPGRGRLTSFMTHVHSCVMKKVNALAVRQSLGKVLRDLERTGEPILVEKGRRPAAVLITLRDFQERFIDQTAADERRRVVKEILDFRRRQPRSDADRRPAVEILREIRGPLGEPRRS